MSNPKNDINILRVKVKRLESSLNSDSLQNISASFLEKIEAINQGVGAVAASVLNVSNNLNTSIETTAMGLQGALEANTVAILGNINELSGNIKETIQQRTEALQEGLTRIVDVLLPTSTSNLQQRADALENSLNTLINVTLPGEFTSKVAAGQLEVSLKGLINQNETTFKQRLDQSDGKLDGVINDVTIITGSWSDYTASINEYTGSAKADMNEVKQFKSDTTTFNNVMKRKTDAFSQDESDETNYRTSLLQAVAGSDFISLKTLNYGTSRNIFHPYPVPENYYAYTVSYPIGTKPFKINSYSYMGTDAGKKTWNLEEVIAYSKREYFVHDGFLGYGAYDANNTMKKDASGIPIITQESQLSFKADKIIAEKGRTNTTSPTLTIIGETSDNNGTGNDQGQLFIRDEDSSTYGLSLGYKYNGTNDYARIQAYNSTPLGLQLGGGQVGIGGFQNGYGILYLKDPFATNINLNSKEGRTIFRQHFVLGNQVYLDTKAYRGRDDREDWYAFSIKQQLKVDDEEAYMASVTYNPFLNNTQHGYGIALETNNKPRILVKDGGAVWIEGGGGSESGLNVFFSDVAISIKHQPSSNAGKIQVKKFGSAGTIGTDNYDLRLNPDGGTVYSNNGVVSTSDERIKYDIKESVLGLEFINKIKPVSYKYKVRDTTYTTGSGGEEIKIEKVGVRPHYGFIAQQIKEALGTNDFAGYIYEPSIDEHALRYEEFISPMVKAIQELSQKNDYLEKKLEEKDKQLQDILLRLSALEGK